MLVGYMRVSLADDPKQIDLQHDALRAAGVDARRLYRDTPSGARDVRPGLKACLASLAKNDTLVVWKLDRLGRSLPHLVSIFAELKTRGVAFRSLTDALDTEAPQGVRPFAVFDLLAQYEQALAQEQVRAGLASARRRGRFGGRPRRLTPEQVEQIIPALEAGASKAAICRTFNVPRSTLIDTLNRAGWTAPTKA